MTPKEKAMEHLVKKSSIKRKDIKLIGIELVKEAIDIALKEQKKGVYEQAKKSRDYWFKEEKEKEKARWDWLEKEIEKIDYNQADLCDFQKLIKQARTKWTI